MGVFSLLCCSVDSKDDADDRYTQSQNLKPLSAQASKQASVKQSPNKDKRSSTQTKVDSKPKKDKSEVVEDENSVNETDTITNADEPAAAAAATTTTAAAGKANGIKPHSTAAGNADVSKTEESEILAQTDANGNPVDRPAHLSGHMQDSEDFIEDDGQCLDLTKLQDGQAFNPETGWLLGKKDPKFGKKKCLILDLDETLVHSSFKYLRIADFVIPVQIDNQVHHVYVIKRPGVDEFLEKVGKWFEVVVFTALVSKYGDPLLDKLDIHKSVHHRLFRDSCYNYQGNFIKNLSQIGRPLLDSIIIDNSPASYIFHPQHSIPISSWFSDTHDNELLDLLPFLEDISKQNVDDVGLVLDISL